MLPAVEKRHSDGGYLFSLTLHQCKGFFLLASSFSPKYVRTLFLSWLFGSSASQTLFFFFFLSLLHSESGSESSRGTSCRSAVCSYGGGNIGTGTVLVTHTVMLLSIHLPPYSKFLCWQFALHVKLDLLVCQKLLFSESRAQARGEDHCVHCHVWKSNRLPSLLKLLHSSDLESLHWVHFHSPFTSGDTAEMVIYFSPLRNTVALSIGFRAVESSSSRQAVKVVFALLCDAWIRQRYGDMPPMRKQCGYHVELAVPSCAYVLHKLVLWFLSAWCMLAHLRKKKVPQARDILNPHLLVARCGQCSGKNPTHASPIVCLLQPRYWHHCHAHWL